MAERPQRAWLPLAQHLGEREGRAVRKVAGLQPGAAHRLRDGAWVNPRHQARQPPPQTWALLQDIRRSPHDRLQSNPSFGSLAEADTGASEMRHDPLALASRAPARRARSKLSSSSIRLDTSSAATSAIRSAVTYSSTERAKSRSYNDCSGCGFCACRFDPLVIPVQAQPASFLPASLGKVGGVRPRSKLSPDRSGSTRERGCSASQ